VIDHYDWAGGREAMLRFGPDTGPVVVMLPALFEEHNRTRSLAVTICRALAALGVASVLPDLPGQGESVVATQDATLDGWRDAVKSLVEAQRAVRPVVLASIRGGAIVDSVPGLSGVWRLSPITGHMVLRDLMRAQAIHGDALPAASDQPIELAGNLIGRALINALERYHDLRAPEAPLRTIRLESDPAPADLKLAGSPLWRRTEPGNDAQLAALLAADLAPWSRQCAG